MKVALLLPGGVDRSGTHRVIPVQLWLIERLAAMGHEVHVFALDQEPTPGHWPLLGATVHNAGRAPRRLRMLGQIVAEHRRAPFALLHAFWAVPSGVVAAAAGAVLGIPVLLHLPGGDLAALPAIGYGARSRWQGRAWTRFAIAGAARVTAPSEFIIAQARDLGIEAERIPQGVALDHWPPLVPRRRAAAHARLLHVASLNRVKDQETLLLAAALLRDRGVAFQLDIIGVDTLDGAVQRRARELGLTGSESGAKIVHFHGFLTQSELRPWMERADLLLVTSRHEAGPIVLLEAAMTGLPTVGTAVGQLAEWAPRAAVAVPVGDFEALAYETAALLADEERRLGIARAAQARAIREDADFTAAATDRIYRSICS